MAFASSTRTSRSRLDRIGSQTLRAAVGATLCMLLVEQPLLAESALRATPPAKAAAAQPGELQGEQRTLHALNRLTFGPRPGDVAAVDKMGLDRWFEQQLNPASIDDSRLDARLAEFPAMQLSISQLAARYPGPQMIRAYESGKLALPDDPQRRAMIEDQIAFYKMQKAKQAAATPDGKAVTAGQDALAANDPDMMPAGKKKAAEADPADDMMADAAAGQPPFARADTERILAMAPDQRVQAILSLPPKDLVRFRQSLRGMDVAQLTQGMSPDQKELLTALPGAQRMVATEATQSRLLRDIYSDRQLEAVMTDFWLNHFNVYMRKNQQEPYLIPTYERETIRAHALGNFEDLLVATAKSPAMLVYLDNFRSTGPDSPAAERVQRVQQMRPNGKIAKALDAGLNENYGRELMELHTLGVNGGYTQKDVTEVAKVFTGWGIERPRQSVRGDFAGAAGVQRGMRPGMGGPAQMQLPEMGDAGQFQFDERKHEPGTKTVLGRTISENGVNEGLEVLHMLASSPATAHFISEKLAIRFVADTPPPALVDRMAQTFLSTHGDIKSVLRTMYKSPEFWSTAVYRAKVKTPEEFVISAVRASDAQVINALPLVAALDRLGQPLYGMQTPQGYAWTAEGWVSTGALVNRMNFSLVLAGDRIPGSRTEWNHLIDGAPAQTGFVPAAYNPSAAPDQTTAAKELKLEQVLLRQPVSDRTRATVLSQANDANVTAQAETQFDLRGQKGDKNAPKVGGLIRGMDADGRRGARQVTDDPQAAVMAGLLLGSPEFQRR